MSGRPDDGETWPFDPSAAPRGAPDLDRGGMRPGGPESSPPEDASETHRHLVARIGREREELLQAAEALRRPMQRVDQVQHAVRATIRHLPLIAIGGSVLLGAMWWTGRWKPPPLRTVLSLTVQGLGILRAVRSAAGASSHRHQHPS